MQVTPTLTQLVMIELRLIPADNESPSIRMDGPMMLVGLAGNFILTGGRVESWLDPETGKRYPPPDVGDAVEVYGHPARVIDVTHWPVNDDDEWTAEVDFTLPITQRLKPGYKGGRA